MKFRKLLWGASLALSSLATQAADETVTLNLANADVSMVLKLASEVTGKSFVLDPKVKGSVNVVSAAPMPRALVYPTLVAALRLQGIAVVDDGKVVRILPEADARQQTASVSMAGASERGRMMRIIAPLPRSKSAGASCSSSCPPCSSMIFLTMARPSPVPFSRIVI